jgi:hypothetical protein
MGATAGTNRSKGRQE